MIESKVCTHPNLGVDRICTVCEQYVMPDVEAGQDVEYYDPTLTDSRKVIGFVLKVARTRRSVSVFVPSSGKILELVRHRSDPKLNESNDHRENGAWDYSPRHRDLQCLRERVESLEAALSRKEKASGTSKTNPPS